MCLSDISPGQCAIVTGFSEKLRIRRRLQDFGIIDGTFVECLRKSPLGDPCAYLIRRTVIAIRKEDARQIYIKGIDREEKNRWNRQSPLPEIPT